MFLYFLVYYISFLRFSIRALHLISIRKMWTLFCMFYLPLFISTLVYILFYCSSFYRDHDSSIHTAFECGFSSLYDSYSCLNVHYFTMVLIFLLLDLEFVLTFWFYQCQDLWVIFDEPSLINVFFSVLMAGLMYE